jgi:hypothetical protein
MSTEKPWVTDENHREIVIDHLGGRVARAWGHSPIERTARARLIAAAPAMLTELRKARAALKEHLDELIKSHTHPDTGLITDDADLLAIESDQDLINGIDRVIAQAEGHAPG